ncbi:hypothetical protein D0Z07_7656 [Hyphodiscus hymeniophilus]|uniref:Uncharacterized protein n=1 Tax=Hyphodiscus hymeniophilus TaxID=353542 RepID=A0A9P7AU58_9HELO|nr:hypothetical protein D0Z07_7656 [Hyphodiscus hymeniophilus]
MPNWKSYESSVRLLSAIIAAHPGLKLNYDEVSKYLGGGSNYKQVWDRMSRINKHAKTLRDAVDHGQDPMTVELNDTAQGGKPKPSDSTHSGEAISARFGGDCTMSAIENRFRRIKSDAKLINDALAHGTDPILLPIGGDDAARPKKSNETAKFCGEGVKPKSIMNYYQSYIKAEVNMIKEKVENGQVLLFPDGNGQIDNPFRTSSITRFHFVKLFIAAYSIKALAKVVEIAKFYGDGANKKAIQNFLFKHYKFEISMIKDDVENGREPSEPGAKEIQKHMGEDITVPALRWQFTVSIRPDAKRLQEARAAGIDCQTIVLNGPGNAIRTNFGSDVTAGALQVAVCREITPKVKLIKATVAAGGDPKDLNLVGDFKSNDLHRYFGSDVSINALQIAMRRHINPKIKALRDHVAAGGDAKDFVLDGDVSTQGRSFDIWFLAQHIFQELTIYGINFLLGLATHMGSDVTADQLKWQFRRYKAGAKLQQAAVTAGRDPKDVNVDVNVKGEVSAPSSSAIAGSYQQGASGKAISTRFERMRKEPCWDLTINTSAGDGSKSTPNKRTPNKAKGTPSEKMKTDVGSDSDAGDFFTPSKKASIKKVQAGRVSKTKSTPRSKSVKSYAEEEDDEEEDGLAVKDEAEEMTFDSNSNHDAYEHDNGYTEVGQNFYDIDEA